MVTSIAGVEDPGRFADTIIAHLTVQISDKQEILEEMNTLLRLEKLLALMEREVEILQIYAAHDAGKAIHPENCIGQIQGGRRSPSRWSVSRSASSPGDRSPTASAAAWRC